MHMLELAKLSREKNDCVILHNNKIVIKIKELLLLDE